MNICTECSEKDELIKELSKPIPEINLEEFDIPVRIIENESSDVVASYKNLKVIPSKNQTILIGEKEESIEFRVQHIEHVHGLKDVEIINIYVEEIE